MEDEDEEFGGHAPSAEEMQTDSDRANFFLQKLQDVTELFESKNEDYAAMEEKLEKLRKVHNYLCVVWRLGKVIPSISNRNRVIR